MKKIFFLLIFLLLLQINAFAQEGWVSQNSGTDSDLSSVFFLDSNNGWVVGRNGTLLRTTDGGKNWITQQTGTTAWLHSIFFLDQNLGWIAGSEFIVTSAVGVVLKTTDGGMNWALDTTELPLSKVFFIDQNIGWAIGNNNEVWPNYYGIIFKTTDGGETWMNQAEGPATSIFSDLCFLNETNGWIMGYLNPISDGIILRTTDGGLNWVNVPNTLHALTTIHFVGDQYGWILASDDILHTTNGGDDWVLQFNWSNTNASDIYFVDQYTGWIVSWGGEIQHSSDEGLNWATQLSGTTNSLTSIYFINNEEGWIVGNNGTILHTTNGGITLIEDNETGIPKEFVLLQNYPNPFNPTTTIKILVPKSSFVNLKVYDILGREVAALINEEKPAGSYEVEFTGNGLSSGIYFYKLQTENYSSIKKMILLK